MHNMTNMDLYSARVTGGHQNIFYEYFPYGVIEEEVLCWAVLIIIIYTQ